MLPSIAAAVRRDLPRLRSVAQAAAITTVCVILVLNTIETLRLADIYILI
jgi:hypothetical protein